MERFNALVFGTNDSSLVLRFIHRAEVAFSRLATRPFLLRIRHFYESFCMTLLQSQRA
jgi:hypothetical protein